MPRPILAEFRRQVLARETGRRPATVLRFHTVLRAAFSQAVRWEWIERNPIERATPPSVQRFEPMRPEVVDVLRVLERAAASKSPDHALVFRLLAATGCRRGEVCALEWCDFQLDGPRPRVMIRRAVLDIQRQRIAQDTKTHAIRWVGRDDSTVELVRQRKARMVELGEVAGIALEPDDFVLPEVSREQRADAAEHCRAGVASSVRRARRPCSAARPPPPAGLAPSRRRRGDHHVAARLGHRDTSTTLRIYSHLMPGADHRAAGIVGKAFSRTPELVATADASHEPEARSADAKLGTSLDAIDQT